MTSPSENYNLRETEYYCEKEKKFFILRAVNPVCPDCGQQLYVALRSLLDGSRITGNDELVKPDYRATSGTRKS